MTEKQTSDQQTTEEAWRQVGQQFQVLGGSLAEAFRTAWKSLGNRREVEDMQAGLKAMVDQVDEALKEASASPEAEKLRQEAEKAAESIRVAGEQTWQEARPQVLSALSYLNTELGKMIDHLRQETPPEAPEAGGGTETSEGE